MMMVCAAAGMLTSASAMRLAAYDIGLFIVFIVPSPTSIAHLGDAGQHQALDVEGCREIAELLQGRDQRVQLGPRNRSGALEEIALAEEVVGLLDILRLDAADGH